MQVRKRFGQHFLESSWTEKIVRAIAPRADDQFVEIGPGRGALTLPLAATGVSIRAVEIDRDLAAELTARAPEGVTVVTGDFLDLPADTLLPPSGPVRVAGNLPYNISSPILFKLLSLWRETGRLVDATLMLQREVAERVAAGPGTGDYGPLSITTALHADVTRVLQLPPGAFRPAPKVHSTVIRLAFRPMRVDLTSYQLFQTIVRTVFQQRRKTLSNALKPALADGESGPDFLSAAGLDPMQRPETVTLDGYARLANLVAASRHRP